MKKVCNNCKLLKPISEFHKNRTKPGGHASTCASCVKPKREQRKRKATRLTGTAFQKNITPDSADTRVCPVCGKKKQLNQFPVDKKQADGRAQTCTSCQRDQANDKQRADQKLAGERIEREKARKHRKGRDTMFRIVGIDKTPTQKNEPK